MKITPHAEQSVEYFAGVVKRDFEKSVPTVEALEIREE